MQNGQIKKSKKEKENRLGTGTREQDERAKENKQTGKRIDTKKAKRSDEGRKRAVESREKNQRGGGGWR